MGEMKWLYSLEQFFDRVFYSRPLAAKAPVALERSDCLTGQSRDNPDLLMERRALAQVRMKLL